MTMKLTVIAISVEAKKYLLDVIEQISQRRFYGLSYQIEHDAKPSSPQSPPRPEKKIATAYASPLRGRRVAPKYSDGVNYWAGRGAQPVWMREKIASGAKLEDFLIVHPAKRITLREALLNEFADGRLFRHKDIVDLAIRTDH